MRVFKQCVDLGRNGQTMIEYVITAGILIAAIAILAVLLYGVKGHGVRVIELVASEYP